MKKILLLLSTIAVFNVQAIIIKHDVEDQKYQNHAKNFSVSVAFYDTWNNKEHVVGNGTYIGEQWVVTAAHVARYMKKGLKVNAKGELLTIEKIIVHPKWQEKKLPFDIALVKLNAVPSKLTPIKLYRDNKEQGKIFTFLGNGRFGNGLTGVSTTDNLQRAATNMAVSTNEQFIQFVFDQDKNSLPLEGISGPGDSGGPGIIELDGELFLAGVSSWQNNEATQFKEGKYGVIEHYSRVSYFIEWLEASLQNNGAKALNNN